MNAASNLSAESVSEFKTFMFHLETLYSTAIRLGTFANTVAVNKCAESDVARRISVQTRLTIIGNEALSFLLFPDAFMLVYQL